MATSTETDRPLHVSFDNGFGPISNAWNTDTSVNGEVKLTGNAAMMEWASGPSAGHGYGTYTVNAKFDGTEPGAAIVFWPGDDKWPGQEIDMGELAHDGSGRQYGVVHWNNGGKDAFEYTIFEGVKTGVFHDYTMVWEPGQITFKVDGVEKGTITNNVPRDHDDGGMNNTIGFLNNNPDTSLTVRDVHYTPLGGGSAGNGGHDDANDNGNDNDTGNDNGAPEVTPDPTPAHHDAPSAGGPIDWNALAAQVQANYEATGRWELPATSTAQEQPAPEPEPEPAPAHAADGPVDWNALAAQVMANYEATGSWHL